MKTSSNNHVVKEVVHDFNHLERWEFEDTYGVRVGVEGTILDTITSEIYTDIQSFAEAYVKDSHEGNIGKMDKFSPKHKFGVD